MTTDKSGLLAETVGFEPTGRSHAQRFSRPPHSTTLPNLRKPSLLWPARFGKQTKVFKTSKIACLCFSEEAKRAMLLLMLR